LWPFEKILPGTNKISRYNMTRPTGIVSRFTNFSDSGIATYRYLPDSLNNGTAWTALEIIRDILNTHLHYRNLRILTSDNGFIPDNQDFTGIMPAQALAALLPLADSNIYIDEDGTPVVFDMFKDISDWSAFIQEGKIFYQGTLLKPERLECYFIKEQEKRFEGVQTGGTATNAMLNVTRLPIDYTISGTTYKKGQYIRIDQLLSAVGINFQEFTKRYPRPNGTIEMFMSLENLELGVKLDEEQRYKMQIYSAVMRDFRSCWMIPRVASSGVDADDIIELNPYRVTIEDNLTGARQPSPVYSDYFEVLDYRRKDKGGNIIDKGTISIPYNAAIPVPALMTIEDQAQGVIRISWGYDETATIRARYFGLLSEDLKLELQTEIRAWHDITMNTSYQMSVIFSCVLNSDMLHKETKNAMVYNNSDKIQGITPKNRLNTEEPFTLKYICFRDRARYDIDGTVVNQSVLTKLADLEKQKIEYSYGNHLNGYCVTEFSNKKMNLEGNMQYIEWEVSEQANTLYDASVLPPPKNQWSEMDPKLRQLVFKSLAALQENTR